MSGPCFFSVFTGKVQDAYASVSSDLSQHFEVVKTTGLGAYELVPESYHQKFCRFRKTDSKT